MTINAKLKHLRISPRKVRLVTDLIRGLNVKNAQDQLKFLNKKASEPVLKLLNSAVANAHHNADLDKENLYISSIAVDPGPTLKRWRPRAMGRASSILKRTSHITLVLGERTPSSDKKSRSKAKVKIEDSTSKDIGKTKTEISSKAAEPIEKTKTEEGQKDLSRAKSIPPVRPYSTTSQSKKRFFSRQTFGNAKKLFRRKSI